MDDNSGEVPPLPPAEEAPKVAEGDPNDIEDEWDIEVTEELDASGIRHKNAFYKLLRDWFGSRDYTCILLTKRKHDEILRFCLDLISGADIRSLYLAGNKQAYKWMAKYDAIVVDKAGWGDDHVIEVEHAVLVLRPKNSAVEAQSLQLCLCCSSRRTWRGCFRTSTRSTRSITARAIPLQRGQSRLTITSPVSCASCSQIAARVVFL
jgi:hypothetical protein